MPDISDEGLLSIIAEHERWNAAERAAEEDRAVATEQLRKDVQKLTAGAGLTIKPEPVALVLTICERCHGLTTDAGREQHQAWHDQLTEYVGQLTFELGKLDQRLLVRLAQLTALLGGVPAQVPDTPSDLPGQPFG